MGKGEWGMGGGGGEGFDEGCARRRVHPGVAHPGGERVRRERTRVARPHGVGAAHERREDAQDFRDVLVAAGAEDEVQRPGGAVAEELRELEITRIRQAIEATGGNLEQRLRIAKEGNPAVTWTREGASCVVAELTVNDAQAEQLTFFMSGKTATGLDVILMEKSVHVTTVDEEGNTSEGLPEKAGTYRLMFDYSEAVAEGFLPDGVIELLPFGMYMLPADAE